MKILLCTGLYPPEIGGPATYAKLLESELPKHGIEVEVLKFSEVRHLPKILRHIAFYRRAVKAGRRADCIFALDPVSVGLPAMWAARRLNKPFILKIVGDYAWEQGRQRFGVTQNLDQFVKTNQNSRFVRILQKIQTRVANEAKAIVVPSNYLKKIIVEWGIPAEKIKVIYNAVSSEELSKIAEPFAEVIKLPKPLIVTVGRLVPWKNIDGIIEAVAILRAKGLAVSLAIIGAGPKTIALKSMAESKLDKNWLFGGGRSHLETLATIKGADVFVLNSTYEGLSHVLIEAALLGVPIVATRIGGNPEVITEGENGLLVPAGDTEALADAVERILKDEKLRKVLSSNQKLVAEKFFEGTMISKTTSIIKELCAS